MITVNIGRDELAALTELHADCIRRARSHERASRRLELDDPHRSELSGDQARQARSEAHALAKLLAKEGVVCPDSRALAIWSDGMGDGA